MSDYQLEIKQIVDYPRCRIHREFIQSLIADRSIRTNNGCSGLFYYAVLCSYANFRTSYRRIDGITYTVYPGEWVCTLKELAEWLRIRTKRHVLDILEDLQYDHLIEYKLLGRDKLVRYRIKRWKQHNTVLDYNCPCQKDTGFYFIPIPTATDLISIGKCSEMDILLDLWISAIYNDERVQGSFSGPVAYFRNGSGNPLVSYADLSARWGVSKATVGRVLKKLSRLGHITLVTFPGRHGILLRSSTAVSGRLPTFSDVEIGGGRITGIETAPGSSEGVAFGMYLADQYTKPKGDFTTVYSADGAMWYKQYAQDTVVRKPYNAPDGTVAYGKGIINNAKTKIVLNLEEEEARRVQALLHLSEAEVMEITHFERGNGLISTNNNNVTVEIKCSQLEKELITTDRRELLELLEKKEHQSHEAEPDDLSGQYGDNTPTISIPD